MGDKAVTCEYDNAQMRAFTLGVLNDLRALEQMLDAGAFDNTTRRIGAEQEMFLVDASMHPAPFAPEILGVTNDPRLTTEIGRFNLEANLTPRELQGSCLSEMEREIHELLEIVRTAGSGMDTSEVLAGILPTIQQSDLTLANLTPSPRYREIDRVVTKLYGKNRVVQIKGQDELSLILQDTTIEFCNTSFQVHLQVGAPDFVRYYNWAQAIAAPVLASAVNSPLLLDHRLWHETRVALFQHAIDTRSVVHRQRDQTPRVNFGDRWVDGSILDILREDAIRFRVLLAQAVEEDSLATLRSGGIPQLKAWRLHNGTIWRWNRPCYGVENGVASLRIEARYLPAGPSVLDQMANAAFFLGLMIELPEEFGDVTKYMSFADARNNFFNAARFGLNGLNRGLDSKRRRVGTLIRDELLPRARRGLQRAGIDSSDSERLLEVIDQRVQLERTGALWMLDSLAAMDPLAKSNVRYRTLTAEMKKNQEAGLPVHEWPLAEIPRDCEWIDNYKTVEQFMSVDLFTVRAEDSLELAASTMDWRRVRHVPVEDDEGRLVGIVSHRDLLHLFTTRQIGSEVALPVGKIMKKDVITVTPDTCSLTALELMREKKIGCLPVLREGKLVGLVTSYDYLTVSAKLLEERLTAVLSQGGRNGSSSFTTSMVKVSSNVPSGKRRPKNKNGRVRERGRSTA